MYGMIHKAVKSMAVDQFGESKWALIAKDADVNEQHFLSMESYDDEIVYRMIGSASRILDVESSQILEAFGRYFILTSLNSQYKNLLKAYGDTSFHLLDNINNLHSSIKSTFTGYSPPRFTVTYLTESKNVIDLEYESIREGLSPFVRGLIAGLAKLYNENLVITEEASLASPTGARTKFRISCEK